MDAVSSDLSSALLLHNKGEDDSNDNKQKHQVKNDNTSSNCTTETSARTATTITTTKESRSPPKDSNLPPDAYRNDPRQSATSQQRQRRKKQTGRNTESFDPSSTWIRPAMRIRIGNPKLEHFPSYHNDAPLKHDDVMIVPDFLGPSDDWSLYYTLVQEITDLQQKNVPGSEWISWHEGSHLIVKTPEQLPTFQTLIQRLCQYFRIRNTSIGTRLNWYKDSSDWKPFHHDSAAFNPQRAKTQNITVGVSLGATRELAFLQVPKKKKNNNNNQHHNDDVDDDNCRIYFPQPNNSVFTLGRDVNIHWKHGINALPESEQDGKGRISIVLWGLVDGVVEEDGSPPLLGSDGIGPHARMQPNHPRKHRNRRNHRTPNNQENHPTNRHPKKHGSHGKKKETDKPAAD